MKLTKPAMMSAFLCPGMGQWASGRRALGGLLITVTVSIVMAPFARFFWAVLRPPSCDPVANGVGGCTLATMGHGWHVTWPVLAACIPAFVLVYVFAVWDANKTEIPDPAP